MRITHNQPIDSNVHENIYLETEVHENFFREIHYRTYHFFPVSRMARESMKPSSYLPLHARLISHHTQNPPHTTVLIHYITRFLVYVHISFSRSGPKVPHQADDVLQNQKHRRTCSVCMARGLQGASSTVPLEATGAVNRRQAEAAADDEGVPLRTGVERGEGVADRLNSWRCQCCALADVEVCQPVDVL